MIGRRQRAGVRRATLLWRRARGRVLGVFITAGDHIGVESIPGVDFTGVVRLLRYG